jgi:glycogen debranching enzyme
MSEARQMPSGETPRVGSLERDPLSGMPLSKPLSGDAAVVRATDLTGVLVMKHGSLFLLADAWGDVQTDSRGLGLYDGDTRVLSRYDLRLNSVRPVVLRTGGGASFSSTIQLTNPDVVRDAPDGYGAPAVLGRQSLGLVRERLLSGGFRERIHVDNYTSNTEQCTLRLSLDSDYADIFEVRGMVRERRGERLPNTLATDGTRLVFAYRGLDGRSRWTHIAFSQPMTLETQDDGHGVVHAAGDWLLAPGARRTLEVTVWTETVAQVRAASPATVLDQPAPMVHEDEPMAVHRAWKSSTAVLETHDPFADQALQRALADLRLLRNPGPGEDERYIAAGVPWFSALFGRDAIITALQLLSIRPQVAAETLSLLARLQATETDDWRDAQPGKILHELRIGELALAGEIPHTPYYGSVDATPLWLLLLAEYARWTGDAALVDRLWPNALAALAWIDGDGDEDGDGFVEYRRRSPRGLVNQGWKDSPESSRRRDGTTVSAPLALVEVQAYVYAARLGIARLCRSRGDTAMAMAQEQAAAELRERFEAAFWMEDVGTYALAIDGQKRQVDAVGSNAGHVLWCGIASPERAKRVATSLMGPGMWSGWGIRTLSSAMGGYNPIGYHIGTIWPHDNAIAASGLARYGFREEAARIAATMLQATRYFRDARLPELFCGFDRATSPYPVPYPVACSPQAWSAGSMFQLLESMLGLEPDADAAELALVAPSLPEWLPQLELRNLRVGQAVVDLRFRRTDHSTGVDVLRRTGDLRVVVRI